MTVMKGNTSTSLQHHKRSDLSVKHGTPTSKLSVSFSVKPSPEIVGDALLQSTNKRRRYMRRGSRAPSMFAIHAVRTSQEVADAEAYDAHQEKIEQQTTKKSLQLYSQAQHNQSLRQVIRRSISLTTECAYSETVNHDLAQSLFHKTRLTPAQKRRLSLEILSRVNLETAEMTGH